MLSLNALILFRLFEESFVLGFMFSGFRSGDLVGMMMFLWPDS